MIFADTDKHGDSVVALRCDECELERCFELNEIAAPFAGWAKRLRWDVDGNECPEKHYCPACSRKRKAKKGSE